MAFIMDRGTAFQDQQLKAVFTPSYGEFQSDFTFWGPLIPIYKQNLLLLNLNMKGLFTLSISVNAAMSLVISDKIAYIS